MKNIFRLFPIIIYIFASCSDSSGLVKTTDSDISMLPTEALISTKVPTNSPSLTRSNTPIPTKTPTFTQMPTETETPTIEPTLTQTAASTQTPTVTLESIYPAVEKVCPENRYVPLSELGLDLETKLVVVPWTVGITDSEGYYLINNEGAAIKVPNVIPKGMEVYYPLGGYSISPGGEWITYSLREQGDTITTVWVSSLDGKEKWIISQASEHSFGYWLASGQILLYGPEDGDRQLFNPFTEEVFILKDIPIGGSTDVYNYFKIADDWFETYYKSSIYDNLKYYLRNQSTGSIYQSFAWISSDKNTHRLNHRIYFHPNGFFISTVQRPYGIDISPEMKFEEVIVDWDYIEIMKAVVWPEELPLSSSTYLIPAIDSIAMGPVHDRSIQYDDSNPWIFWFYSLDYKNWIIKDYCFAIRGTNRRAGFTQDGRFFAYTHEDDSSGQEPVPKTIHILNLETGFISQIEDWQFIGWGRVDE